jgi:Aldo/keto reductase family
MFRGPGLGGSRAAAAGAGETTRGQPGSLQPATSQAEMDGVLDARLHIDVALVAHRPIGRGTIGAGSPAGAGRSDPAAVPQEVAASRSATVPQVALAWLLKRDDHVNPIPGATRPEHVRENSGALLLELRRRVRRPRPGIGADAGQVAPTGARAISDFQRWMNSGSCWGRWGHPPSFDYGIQAQNATPRESRRQASRQ